MLYLVTLKHNSHVATIVVDVPEDYDFSEDVHLPSRTGHFTKLKQLCQEQVPSGFHGTHWMLQPMQIEHTMVVAVSKLQ